ncbi:hypothetical protein PTSG_07074 [Salpingoeca rosetta]|uniref:Uncharacterized protein n=1 Tax=Salpingoeca rosetta (strain ATCC 50818 / BSB-021) TaxID=946362 RepID=F2UDZ4_SALR5|nr:uncharacterized protein PTSG_07074 [Salpingoeca rosetta]EGD74844.1 hypothetical protein PTSG_07074 [Salpingoeca rosetta]|eukprot:XP_004992489.1 hypothetical protein PTSG_07074 [Salpingoeca rosetta]
MTRQQRRSNHIQHNTTQHRQRQATQHHTHTHARTTGEMEWLRAANAWVEETFYSLGLYSRLQEAKDEHFAELRALHQDEHVSHDNDAFDDDGGDDADNDNDDDDGDDVDGVDLVPVAFSDYIQRDDHLDSDNDADDEEDGEGEHDEHDLPPVDAIVEDLGEDEAPPALGSSLYRLECDVIDVTLSEDAAEDEDDQAPNAANVGGTHDTPLVLCNSSSNPNDDQR